MITDLCVVCIVREFCGGYERPIKNNFIGEKKKAEPD